MVKQSMYQIQSYVNERKLKLKLNKKIRECIKIEPVYFEWVSPLESDEFKEYSSRFLYPLGLGYFSSLLLEYWPKSGPQWDALAIVREKKNGKPKGILLCEAKSYLGEVKKHGSTKATNKLNKDKIESCLKDTKNWIQANPSSNWFNKHYQEGNRYAHVRFFKEILKIPAWYCRICFINDPTAPKNKQTSEQQWIEFNKKLIREMGLADYPDFVFNIYLNGVL